MTFWTILPFVIFFITLILSRWILAVFSGIFMMISDIFRALSDMARPY